MPPLPAAPARPSAEDPAARSTRGTGAAAGLIAAGVAAYLVALIVTLPASVVAPRGSAAAGTVWHGAMAVPGGATVRWDWSPGESFGHAAFAADWTLDGPATVLTGVARLRPLGGTELATVRGRAAWPLLAAAVPGLPPCTIPLIVAVDTVAASGGSGTVRSLPGSCPGSGGTTRPVPRLVATIAGRQGRVTPWSDRAATYATVTVTGTTVQLHVTPAGATVFGSAADIEFAM